MLIARCVTAIGATPGADGRARFSACVIGVSRLMRVPCAPRRHVGDSERGWRAGVAYDEFS